MLQLVELRRSAHEEERLELKGRQSRVLQPLPVVTSLLSLHTATYG